MQEKMSEREKGLPAEILEFCQPNSKYLLTMAIGACR
jgi:hypothetical protein